jgi:Rps23 Pro-64 3,4-dihydroxylase Tpa1-like proline 4-hydroxylase
MAADQIISYQDESILVVDNFLTQDEHKSIYNQCQLDVWGPTNQGDDKFWHLTDGANYKNQKRWLNERPFGDSFDIWFDKILEFYESNSYLKEICSPLNNISARCHAYPSGSKNPWHTDLGVATYTYYLHKKWQANWGAELLYFSGKNLNFDPLLKVEHGNVHRDSYQDMKAPMEMFEQQEKLKNILYASHGRFITAVPNRVVFINKNVVHGVGRVDSDAGENIRLSITGLISS